MADVIRLTSFHSFYFSSFLLTSSFASNLSSLPPSNQNSNNHNSYKRIYPLIYSSAGSVSRFVSTPPRKQLVSFKVVPYSASSIFQSFVLVLAGFLNGAIGPLTQVHATVAETDQPKWWEKNAGPNMIDIHSTQEFLGALSQAGDRLVIVEFYGTWCASCRALFPKLCRTAEEHSEILFLKVNFDENKPMCKSLNVKVLPYFHFYRGAHGQLESFSCSLAKFQKIKDAIAMHNTAQCSSSDPPKGVGELTLEYLSAPKDKPTTGSA